MRYLHAPPFLLRFLTRGLLCWRFPGQEKKIFLTFDDGPTPGVTEKILEILANHHARATFFVLGKNAGNHPGLLAQILRQGHLLGNHGWDHLNGWQTPLQQYLENVERFGLPLEIPLFRPPYGRITPAQARKLKKRGYRVVMWSVLTRDFDTRLDPEKAFKRIISLTRKGSILVFHDSLKASNHCLELLPKVLKHFSALGYAFEPIPHMK